MGKLSCGALSRTFVPFRLKDYHPECFTDIQLHSGPETYPEKQDCTPHLCFSKQFPQRSVAMLTVHAKLGCLFSHSFPKYLTIVKVTSYWLCLIKGETCFVGSQESGQKRSRLDGHFLDPLCSVGNMFFYRTLLLGQPELLLFGYFGAAFIFLLCSNCHRNLAALMCTEEASMCPAPSPYLRERKEDTGWFSYKSIAISCSDSDYVGFTTQWLCILFQRQNLIQSVFFPKTPSPAPCKYCQYIRHAELFTKAIASHLGDLNMDSGATVHNKCGSQLMMPDPYISTVIWKTN